MWIPLLSVAMIFQEIRFCPFMNYHIPFSRKNKKNIFSLWSAEFSHGKVSVKKLKKKEISSRAFIR